MKDIDFDELDRAVSSVLQTTPSAASPVPTDAVKTPNATPSTVELSSPPLSQDAEQSDDTPVVQPIDSAYSSVDDSSASLASPATKRSGRFMDVMHPSSDMRTAAVSAPSREGVALSPLSTEADQTPPTIEMIDEVDTSDSLAQAFDSLDATMPLQSPFLPDAQVDKRPLGGTPPAADNSFGDLLAKELTAEYETTSSPAASESTPVDDPMPSEPATAQTPAELYEDPQEQLPPSPEVAAVPEELAGDIVMIESLEAQPASVNTAEAVNTPLAPAESSTAPLSTPVQGSIPQQYTEQPSTSDQSHTPIYDTEAVPQPLAHPAKKKSGWLVVVWIFLIVALAVGGVLGLHFLGYL